MHAYEVGTPYSPGRSSWPEVAQYQFRAGAHELVLFLRSPTRAEVEAVARGPLDLALSAAGDQLVLLYRARGPRLEPGVPWSDAPYAWHRVPDEERTEPPRGLAADERALLTVLLVGADDGLVKAIRLRSLGPVFTAHLHAAIRDQAAMPWDAAAYDRHLAALYRRYPTVEDLLRAPETVRDDGP